MRHVGTINEPNIVAMFAADSHNGMAALHSGLPVPDARVTDTLIDVHRAGRAATEGRRTRNWLSGGAFRCRTAGPTGAEHVLQD